jgi:hypothetical protein
MTDTTLPAPLVSAEVVRLPVRTVNPSTPEALGQLARRHAAWRRNNPTATFDEDLAAGADIAKELGLA